MHTSAIARRASLLLAAAAFLTLSAGHVARAVAQSGSVTITTDQPQYQVGATAQVCYTVAGAGPIVIIDHLGDGSSQPIVTNTDDGSGACFSASVTPPTGTECLQLNATSGGTTGTSETCFQVLATSTTAPPTAQDCGEVDVLGGHVSSSGSPGIESCFYQGYQSCTPVTLEVSLSGVDAGVRHTFGLTFSGGFCAITDSQQHFVVPRPPQPATTTLCTGLSQSPDGGLLFSDCGGNDVAVPVGS